MEANSRTRNLIGAGLIVVGLVVLAIIVSGILGAETDADPVALKRADSAKNPSAVGENSGADPLPPGTLPTIVEQGPNKVRRSYEFASNEENHEVLRALTCYCGCTGRGHTDLLNCYIKEIEPDGDILYESHAIGCSLCLREAADTEKWVGEGKSKAQIKKLIDQRYGPSRSTTSSPDF